MSVLVRSALWHLHVIDGHVRRVRTESCRIPHTTALTAARLPGQPVPASAVGRSLGAPDASGDESGLTEAPGKGSSASGGRQRSPHWRPPS
jgi:hypothetical protein